MKASELIKELASIIATSGDNEVYVTSGLPGHYMPLSAGTVKPSDVHKKPGTQLQYVHAGKARELRYDTPLLKGLVLG